MTITDRLRAWLQGPSQTPAEQPGGPLEGLTDVDWAAFDHAYGPATDVPGQLRAVSIGRRAKREAALYELWGNIHHQGTVYPASAPAVPFLARLAADPSLPWATRAELVHLLAAIASGSSYLDVHGPLMDGGLDATQEAKRQRELEDVRAAHAAVASEASSLLDTIPTEDRLTTWALVRLAAQVPEVARPVRDRIAALHPADHPTDRIVITLTLDLIDGTVSWERIAAVSAADPELAELGDPANWTSADDAAKHLVTACVEDSMDRHAG